MASAIAPKDTAKARAGLLGARARWKGERRVVRLAELSPSARRVVLALIEADRKADADGHAPASAVEVRRAVDEQPTEA